MNKRQTFYLGSDDGDEDGMNGYGYEATREDAMVLVTHTEQTGPDQETAYEFYIMRDLFPKIRAAMDRVDNMFK